MEVLDMIYDGVQKIDKKLDEEVRHLRKNDGRLFERVGTLERTCAANHGNNPDATPPPIPTTFNGKPKTEIKVGPLSITSTSLEATKYIAVLAAIVIGVFGIIYIMKMKEHHAESMAHVITKLETIEKNGNGDTPHP